MVSEISLGTWQLGTKWGDPFNETEAQKILEASYESGINLIDTADIYTTVIVSLLSANLLQSIKITSLL